MRYRHALYRVLQIIAFSAFCGALSGFSSLIFSVYRSYIGYSTMAGGVIGLLVSPILIYPLARISLRRALPIMLIPAMLTAAAFGALDAFPVSLVSVPIFIGSAFYARTVLPGELPPLLHSRDPHALPPFCPRCDYSLAGLPGNCPCPECGHVEETRETSSS